MSTIRVNNLQNTSTTDGGISINASGHVTVDGVAMPSAGPLSNRNLVINGAMQVAQRGTQATGVTTGGYRTIDRFNLGFNVLGTWTIDQSTDSPNEFSNSLKVTNTTADASPDAGDYALVAYEIEAQNLQGLGYGSSDAKTLTLSFWVKSNKTGSASVDIRQRDNSNKLFSAIYSISSANTWEYKTIAIPADTAGNINNDSGSGLSLSWWLNSGSNFTGGSAASTWSTADNTRRNPSNLGVGGATSDYFAITGIQLEVGSVATPFEHRSYGDELARCQRYFLRLAGGNIFHGRMNGTNNVDVSYFYPVTPRVVPTGSSSFDTASAEHGSTGLTVNALTLNETQSHSAVIRAGTSNAGTNGAAAVVKITGTSTIDFSAEL